MTKSVDYDDYSPFVPPDPFPLSLPILTSKAALHGQLHREPLPSSVQISQCKAPAGDGRAGRDAYGYLFLHSFQVLPECGAVVFLCNYHL